MHARDLLGHGRRLGSEAGGLYMVVVDGRAHQSGKARVRPARGGRELNRST
jgi:hypothetical protein